MKKSVLTMSVLIISLSLAQTVSAAVMPDNRVAFFSPVDTSETPAPADDASPYTMSKEDATRDAMHNARVDVSSLHSHMDGNINHMDPNTFYYDYRDSIQSDFGHYVFDLNSVPEKVAIGTRGSLAGIVVRPFMMPDGKIINAEGTYSYTLASGSDVLSLDSAGNYTALKNGEAVLMVTFKISDVQRAQFNKDYPNVMKNEGAGLGDINRVFRIVVGINPLYRLYNPGTGEHFYTVSETERDSLMVVGWQYEGLAQETADNSKTPVYRVYNPNAGDHHYTTGKYEVDQLVRKGWRDEGIAFYTDTKTNKPVFRLYNPNTKTAGAHFYTQSSFERDSLITNGWKSEGTAWFAD